MRKQFALLIVLCILLTGCSGNTIQKEPTSTDASVPGHDAQNQYLFTTAMSFQETDSFYCGNSFDGRFLNYYDKASGISGILCADPSCAHDSSECSAFIEAGASLSVYDNHLYWIAQDAETRDYLLWRSNLSGMDREVIKRLSFEDLIIPYQPQRYVVHQGMLYILGESQTVVGTETSMSVTLLSTPLNDSEDFSILQDESYTCGVERTIRFLGNQAYICMITFVPGSGCFDVAITKLDLTEGTRENIYYEKEVYGVPKSIWVTETGEIYLPWADETYAYIWKVEAGTRTEIISWPAVSPSAPQVLDGIAVYLTRPEDVRYAQIMDLNGNPIYRGKLFPEGIPGIEDDPNTYNMALIGGDNEKLILNLQSYSEQGLLDYTVSLDIQNDMKPTVLWSSQK